MPGRCVHALARSGGQAGLDYVAVLAVAAVALTAGTGVAMARGGDLASAVRSQFARAICIVTSGDCSRDLAPCVTRTRHDTVSAHVNVLIVKVGKDHVAMLDELADGTYAVSLAGTWTFGLDGGLGLDAQVKLGRRTVALGGEFRAAALAREGRGRTWILRSRAEADALVSRIRGIRAAVRGPDLPEPDLTYYEHGSSVSFGVQGAAGPATGSLTLQARDLDGTRTDRRSGRELHYLKRSNALDGVLGASGGRGGATTGEGLAAGDHVWAFERDRDGRPIDLMILSSGEYHGSFSLPPLLSEIAGYLGAPAPGTRRYEVETHLDLTDADNLAVAREYLGAVLDGGPRPGRSRAPTSDALAARLRDHGIVHARTYEVDSRATGAGAHSAVGGKVGGGGEQGTRTARLLAATTRGPDGTWRLRTECLDSVRQ